MAIDTRWTGQGSRRGRRRWPRRLGIALLVAIAILVVLLLLVTSGSPRAAERHVPTAEQVGAGRDAVLQLRSARAGFGGRSYIRLGPAQLDGFSALASHGFRPDRLDAALRDGVLSIDASHHLPLGRWLNVSIRVAGRSTGFPETRMRVGALSFGPGWSRRLFELARFGLRLRGANLPPLDSMVRDVSIEPGLVTATLSLPRKTGLVDQMAGTAVATVDETLVVQTYCRLAAEQRVRPSHDFAAQVRRAFTRSDGSDAEQANRAAFVALAMLIVSDQVGDLAGKARADTLDCRIPPIRAEIHGRGDLPKHWILSAAFAVTAGGQFAQAIGEWKELADSLAKESMFARGDPSGFSFIDLAADRAGFTTAQAAIASGNADRVAARLADATPEQLLPPVLLQRPEGLSNADFVARFGGLDDPRYKAAMERIERVLAAQGVR